MSNDFPIPASALAIQDPIARLSAILKSQVGYREGFSGGHYNNHNKYAPDVPALTWAQNQPWCATLNTWGAQEAGLSPYYPITASVPAIHQWALTNETWSEWPAVGAWVVIGKDAHTGTVVDFDPDYITTVEGNTNDNGSAEGNGVYLRRRLRRSTSVLGYAYPLPSIPTTLRSADPNYHAASNIKTVTTHNGDTLMVAGTTLYHVQPGQIVKVK